MTEHFGQQERHPQRAPVEGPAAARTMPEATAVNPMLVLQQTIGNQAVQRQIRAGALSPRVLLGQQPTLGNRAVQRLLAGSRPLPTPVAADQPVQRQLDEAWTQLRMSQGHQNSHHPLY